MGRFTDYVGKSVPQLEHELRRLITRYNSIRGNYLLVYASAMEKPIPDLPLNQADYYLIFDLLHDKNEHRNLDVYIETPGGSAAAAESIVRFFRGHFEQVSFIVSGEAKSAGTILVLSGDEIWLTKTGSLGPIDAQVKIGRSQQSAHDYMEWIKAKQEQAQKEGALNPFDATMVAQIPPGELLGVNNALQIAQELVVEWLQKYKFRTWTHTETQRLEVTDEMKLRQAREIAACLTDQGRWRLHGRSIQADELDGIGLKIKRVDDLPDFADVVYRIQIVCKLLYDMSPTYKIFATQDALIRKQAMPSGMGGAMPMPLIQKAECLNLTLHCNKCGTEYRLYKNLAEDPNVDAEMKKKGLTPFPKDAKINCSCGAELDLMNYMNQIEEQLRGTGATR